MQDQEFIVQKICSQYTETVHTELDALKELAAKVKKPVKVFTWIYGSVGAIVMGTGMSLVMTDIGKILGLINTMFPGIVIGVIGLVMVCSTYPIYKEFLNSRKKRFAPQIMELSDKLISK